MNTGNCRISGIAGAILFIFLLLTGNAAHAALQAAGPVSPTHGFPEYYRDLTGRSLALCLDQNGFCVLPVAFDPAKTTPPASITNLATSITSTNFPPTSSYWVANARQNAAGPAANARFDLTMSLDASFAAPGPVAPVPTNGQQITFLSIVLKAMKGLTPNSTYTVRHPFGQFTFTTDGAGASQAVKLTDGGGVGAFTALLPAATTAIGPFLTCAGGPVAGPGGTLYIGNPGAPCAVVGGPRGNIVQATGPNIGGAGVNTITIAQFAVAGKIIAMSTTPALLTFPTQSGLVPSAPQVVTVTNVTGAALTPGAITSTNPNFTIPAAGGAAGNLCSGVSVPASGACTFDVVFQGTPPDGVKTGIVNIAAPAGNPAAAVNVSGVLDSTAPAVISTIPANGASVAANSAIAVTFSEPVTNVNNTTFALADSGGGPVTGAVALDAAGRTATFTPAAALAIPGTFAATITGGAAGVADLAGNVLAANFTLNFATAAPDAVPPTVLSTTPVADTADINPTTPITVVFSESMDPTTINQTTITLSGAIPATVTYDQATKTATLTPSRPLDAGAVYVATVTRGVKDLAQNTLAADFTWRFVVDAGPSAPQLVSPAEGATVAGTSVDFQWTKSIDPDGDVITYQLFYCTNQQMFGCSPVAVTAAAVPAAYLAGIGGYGAGLLVVGFVIAGVKSKKKIMFLIAVLIVAGTMVSSCSKSSSEGTPAPGTASLITKTVTGLTSGTTYYWKVVADDGNGVLAESEIRSFTTE